MTRAIELLKQGRYEDLWEATCGFIGLSLEQFMAIQKRLLLEQMELLNHSGLGKRVMRGERPESVEEFRETVPLTTYADYCPELIDKREDYLPEKPAQWVRTSGRSGEYPCRWVPMTPVFSREMSRLMYGLGILASCRKQGKFPVLPKRPKVVYTVAPRPYVSGAMACMLEEQTPADFMPPMDLAESLPFEDRVKLGFKQALSQGIEYFFGLSLVLATVGDKISEPSEKPDIRSLINQPKAMLRLAKAMVKAKLARRAMLPRDLWSVKGIISSGLDSWVYRDKIKKFWGRYPLDAYVCTEGGIIATQTWDYDSMTFIPNLNFLEFIPESEHLRWELDHSYQPRTVLLDQVKVGENYEIVITNFHGGAMVRYRIGDMVRITSLHNAKLGINLPQMVFERRTDDVLYFTVVKLAEKIIWQAIERTGIAYQDWTAYKDPGGQVLHLLIEPKGATNSTEAELAVEIRRQILDLYSGDQDAWGVIDDWKSAIEFRVDVTFLSRGAFASYTARKQAEGADLAHLKPPHLNPSDKILSTILARPVRVTQAGRAERAPVG